MQRAVLVALLVALGCTAVLANSPPCAPVRFTTGISIAISGVYGAYEFGEMAVDFEINAVNVNITAGVTASNEPFIGSYLYVNNTGYWIQQGQCFPTNISAFGPVRCLTANGNYSTDFVGGVNVTSYTYIGNSNSSAFTYSTANNGWTPIMYQEFDWSETNAPANSTGIIYNNFRQSVDPAIFVVPGICVEALQKQTLTAETHHGRVLKKLMNHPKE